ncbi:N-acetyltransferase family protein [Rhodoferax sp.]|uniref:GNAT family N-acetyltransferase n=1 Tax=Rhodoferax sp. TaxID=50421 RepID=UPI0027548A70|nr:GNAT family N-acetyltransferase [Rhodoferax sp.]
MQYLTSFAPLPAPLVQELAELSELVFSPPAIDHHWRLGRMPEVSIFYARNEGGLIAFKTGYAIAESKYYSWLGAVHPDFRRRGIARQLTGMQHAWLVARGYCAVETSSRAENRIMAHLNLTTGFVMQGTKVEPHGLQVLWSKRLA